MSVVDAKPFVMRIKSFATLSPVHCVEPTGRGKCAPDDRLHDEAIHLCPGSMDCFASLAMTISACLCLLLLLLLVGLQHPPFCQFDRLAQDFEIADVIGEDENQCGVEIGARLIAQSPVGLEDRTKSVIGLFKVRTGR